MKEKYIVMIFFFHPCFLEIDEGENKKCRHKEFIYGKEIK